MIQSIASIHSQLTVSGPAHGLPVLHIERWLKAPVQMTDEVSMRKRRLYAVG